MLPALPAKSIQCVVTSPPYFGLRDYGVDGQMGQEKTPDEFVASLVAVFREVWRVLRDDGTVWLVLGDCYNAYNGNRGSTRGISRKREDARPALPPGAGLTVKALKPKDLIGIPWMVAFALRADGWTLRSGTIWNKPNPMPESVDDRPTNSHEYLFLLTKRPDYFYDAEAIKEEGVIPAGTRAAKGSNVRSELKKVNSRPPEYWEYDGMRNARSVWTIPTVPFGGAHFATFPPDLAERCIQAGTSECGCCPQCGAPWARIMKKRGVTTGWQPSCKCGDPRAVPCTVLDPFGGSGTVGMVARNIKRDAILIELNPEYADMARRRSVGPLFAVLAE